MKILYQIIILLVDGALCLIVGWAFYIGIDTGTAIITNIPVAGVFAFLGGMCCLLFIVKLLYKPGDQPGPTLHPYREGADYPLASRRPAKPREPGGT